MSELFAPWTERQVLALKKHQEDSTKHPYTCHKGHTYTPTKDGWVCSECKWGQDWCHKHDACDDDVKELLAAMDEETDGTHGFERALYLLLKAFATELPAINGGFHKAFRQIDITESGEIDMAIWCALQESKAFWAAMERVEKST